jgi:FtsP/CotA-like multicopper oxidase with cupredoxin domain
MPCLRRSTPSSTPKYFHLDDCTFEVSAFVVRAKQCSLTFGWKEGVAMKCSISAVASLCSLALALPASAATNTMNHLTNAMSKHAITINMGAQNGSKQDGQAWLNDTPGGLRVKIQLKNEPPGASEPSHIHQGTCAKLNPAPWKALSNVVGGVSVTTLPGVTIAQLKKAHYAINVHESAANLKRYVSCGDI